VRWQTDAGRAETDFAKRWFVGTWLALLGLKLWLAARLPLFVDEAFTGRKAAISPGLIRICRA
jgi:hypothetical protein